MVKLGMVGKVLIHNYPYGAYFNGTDAQLLEERCTKQWMLEFIRGRFAEPVATGSRITHVWAGDRAEAEAIAAGCKIEQVCDSLDEVIENVDGVLVLDEDAEFRTETIERCLQAGKSVYADKVVSLSPEKTRELVTLAEQKNLRLAAWSQLLFAAEAEMLKGVEGGAALVTFNLKPDIVARYGIHLVCSAMAAFGTDPIRMESLPTTPAGPPMMTMTYADGKHVLLRAGEDVPPRGTIAYLGPGAEPMVVKLFEMAPMFDGSSAALADMFENRTWPVPPDAVVRMSEAAALLCDATGRDA